MSIGSALVALKTSSIVTTGGLALLILTIGVLAIVVIAVFRPSAQDFVLEALTILWPGGRKRPRRKRRRRDEPGDPDERR